MVDSKFESSPLILGVSRHVLFEEIKLHTNLGVGGDV